MGITAVTPTDRRVGTLNVSCLVILILTALQLLALNLGEMKALRATGYRRALIPRVASLSGVDATGAIRTPAFGDSGYLLMFILRSDRMSSDLAYWNDVAQRISRSPAPIELWGICDAGAACGQYQSSARFNVIGFLDPHGMRSIVTAHARGEALLYDGHRVLATTVKRAPDSLTTSEEIRRSVQ